ncbi:MAG: glycosyltransferase family 4 protein [Faecousia sp.]
MKLLWLCNMVPGKVKEVISGSASGGGLWVDSVLEGLLELEETEIRILCPGDGGRGAVSRRCSYAFFSEGLPYVYLPELEKQFREELDTFRPEVIHVWGTEYGHTLAMVNAAEKAGVLDRLVVSIQGLCSVYAGHYAEGVPERIRRGSTFRDLVRRDNIVKQREKFVLRGVLEAEALQKARHVIGRTDWDFACTRRINPETEYHFCNETLRRPFYEGAWRYESCQRHRIFASSCAYPVKGFHYLLEAFAELVKTYPDATLAVPGKSFLTADRLRRTNYQKYLAGLARQYGVEDKIEFLGSLSAEGMKQAFLSANVFVLPSTIENSPNSLGEAMLLGVPCVAADVGGVANMLRHGAEGYVYPSSAPYMLAHYIGRVFDMEKQAEALGTQASAHAGLTHDPEKNLKDLLEIYLRLKGRKAP